MTTCFLMIPPNGFVSAMSCRDIGGNGPPPRDTNPLPSLERVQSVRRRLPFGDIDHQQTHLDLQNQLRQCHEMDRNRYNFDFQSEQPINSSDSRYEWSHISSDDTQQDTNDTNISQEFSTKLCKTNDHESTQSSQSATSSPSQPPLLSPLLPPLPTLSDTGAHIVSSALASDPTSATFAPDSQPQASSSAVGLTLKVGHKKQIVSQSKQTKITDFYDGRKSAPNQRKRSAAQLMSPLKDRQTKRHRLECTSAVIPEESDTRVSEEPE